MRKRKIVLSDLDGTIVKHNDGLTSPRSILSKDKEWIQELDRNNDVFILSSSIEK